MTDTIDTLLMNTPYRVTGFLGRVFAAGLVLYSMLTRRGPYDSMRTTDSPETFQIQPPSERANAFIPPELDAIVLKAIRWNAFDRYQTVSAFASDLQSVRDTLELDCQGYPNRTTIESGEVFHAPKSR